ncbi:hypothetical protein G5B88_15180 [Herbaspirillum seropedicae]|uniref:hypothetical protein n=1 Tax=Herbaspirillum seropedicae TaxID=964 RepID=UPI0002D83130|nr:hypothetical protein [Herbaspirillum seropedicae]AKN66417.1 hypothetical protein ACP92_15045 [Herbaspirillum seropedicae]MDR6393698.1 N-acetylglutamate synthase-like GNAT family acetyltransferase [Herbaspirillum seropedicae]NQE30480.1 hypothetical protein [Herbaspirillum seropedicae]QDD65322.1 hypothetical protein EJD96_14705 [Herbaspirillum seropedicae]UMU22407.1 hypothetical protein G5B88_15180 [Herbaspirillum seropedicae]
MNALPLPAAWKIEGPRERQPNEVHVYAYLEGSMIAMLDCELRESDIVQLRMAYVSPPWRGSAVLRDMLAVLKHRYRRIDLRRSLKN